MRDFNKIFGIGISRTGTLSLTRALEELGIAAVHWPNSMDEIARHRGATDVPVACRFRELDAIFPNSLFVYTERDRESWLASVTAHYLPWSGSAHPPDPGQSFRLESDIRIYGRLNPTADDFPAAYDRHHDVVMQYFSDKAARLLRMNIGRGDGWRKLCEFLQAPIPEASFPYLNARRRAQDAKTIS